MDDQDNLLDLLEVDPIHQADRDRIDAAVRQAARQDHGIVSTNTVRRLLTNRHGLTVTPQLIGPRLRALTLAGVLRLDGWETNDDTAGRNSGKPQRRRRWAEALPTTEERP